MDITYLSCDTMKKTHQLSSITSFQNVYPAHNHKETSKIPQWGHFYPKGHRLYFSKPVSNTPSTARSQKFQIKRTWRALISRFNTWLLSGSYTEGPKYSKRYQRILKGYMTNNLDSLGLDVTHTQMAQKNIICECVYRKTHLYTWTQNEWGWRKSKCAKHRMKCNSFTS
jgi:hypothetical protein